MKTMTDAEAIEWCNSWPIQLKTDNDGIIQTPDGWQSYRVDLSKMAWRELVPVARSLAFLGCQEIAGFMGALVWIKRTCIAVPEMDETVLRTLERFRLGYGETRSLEVAQAQLFRDDESAELGGFLSLVLLAEWDAYVVHPGGEWLATISHDDYIKVDVRSEDAARVIKDSLESWGETISV